MTDKKEKLRAWWIPRVPMKAFNVEVESIKEAKKVLDVLGLYDLFQEENKIIPEFSNAGGLEVYLTEETGKVEYDGWHDWYNDEYDDIDNVDEDGKSLF